MSLTLSNIKVHDCKPVIEFSIKKSKENFSWELFVFQKTISEQLTITYVSTLPLFFFYQNDIHVFTNNIYNIKTQRKYIYIKPNNTATVP